MNSYREPLHIEFDGIKCQVALVWTVHFGVTHDFTREFMTGITSFIPNGRREYEVDLEIFIPNLERNKPGLIPVNQMHSGNILERLLLEVGKRYGKWRLISRDIDLRFGDACIARFKFIASEQDAWFVDSEPPQIADSVIYLGTGDDS